MADAKTLNIIAGLLRGFQQGYGGAKEQAASEEERAMRNRFQQKQMENIDADNEYRRLQMEQQAPLIQAQTSAMLGKNQEVAPEIANPILGKLGINPTQKPISNSTFGTLGGMINNLNTNETRRLKPNTPGNTDKDVLRAWTSDKKSIRDNITKLTADINANKVKLTSIMNDPVESQKVRDELNKNEAYLELLKDQLDRHNYQGMINGINPALTQDVDESGYSAYKAKKESEKLAASNIMQTQQPMSVTNTAMPVNPTVQRPSLKDALLNALMKR